MKSFFKMVGMTRFERATPSSQAKCATKLRYIPSTNYSIITHLRQVHDNLTLNKIINQVFILNLLYNINAMTNLLINNTKNNTEKPEFISTKQVSQKTCARILVETLTELGVDSIFGYPGAAVLSIYNELSAVKNIRHYLVRH